MANPLLGVAWEKSCALPYVPDPALDAEARRVIGTTPSWAGYFSGAPWLVRALLRFHTAAERVRSLDALLGGQVGLVVSQENSCRYCYAAVRLMLRLQGLSEARVQVLEAQLSGAAPDARSQAALRFARRLARFAPRVGADDLAALRAAGFDDRAIGDIAVVAAYTIFANRAVTVPAIPPQDLERLPERWLFRLFSPLAQRLVNGQLRRLRAAPPPPPARLEDGPFAALVQRLAGSEVAAVIAQTMHELWQSPVLPRRSKLLMIAVIGRALDCGHTLDEAAAALHSEGVDRAAVAEALTHLRGPALGPLDPPLLDFARETVWYQTVPMQRRAQALCRTLPPEVFVEALGVAALANALCRFRAVAERL